MCLFDATLSGLVLVDGNPKGNPYHPYPFFGGTSTSPAPLAYGYLNLLGQLFLCLTRSQPGQEQNNSSLFLLFGILCWFRFVSCKANFGQETITPSVANAMTCIGTVGRCVRTVQSS